MTILLTHREWTSEEILTFLAANEQSLQGSITRINELARRPGDTLQREMESRYTAVRRFLPRLLRTIDFATTQTAQPLQEAYTFLKAMDGKKQSNMTQAPLTFVPHVWKRHVAPKGKPVNYKMYTMCFLLQLQEGLHKRDVFVRGSKHWSDPRARLYQGEEWIRIRPIICQMLNRSPIAEKELALWEKELHDAYQQTAAAMTPGSKVTIQTITDIATGKQTDELHIDKLEAQEEPSSLQRLRRLTEQLMPTIDLPTLLLEIAAKTGFVDDFTHIGEQQARMSDFPISMCAALLVQACNLPISAVAQKGIPALESERLIHVTHNYIRPETIARANARLVEVHTRIPITSAWGGGDVASADGLRFVVPVHSVHSGPNPRYFGQGRGITLLNYTLDHFFGFNGEVVTGTIRDSLNILDGVLQQDSPLLQPQEIMTDTASYSDIVFALFSLLGYQFSPRLADMKDMRFWRFLVNEDYGALNEISRHKLTRELIATHWDEILRGVGSLKMGRITASDFIRMLSGGKTLSPLGRAFMEVGRIAKTAYLLRYLYDENYRRRILIQLNRGESRHSLARAIHHGRKGEIRQAYKEGMEEQLGALGLVVNMVILWNAFYLDRAVTVLRERGLGFQREDIQRLSPLGYDHIALYGQYPFTIAEYIQKGDFLPLREIADQEFHLT